MRNALGLTLIEMLVVIAILGVLLGIAAISLRPLETPLQNGTAQLEGFFKQARAKAMATTRAYRVVAQGNQVAVGQYANSCAATAWTADPVVRMELPQQVRFSNTTWTVCFGSRGLAAQARTVGITDGSRTQQIEVLLGGSVRRL